MRFIKIGNQICHSALEVQSTSGNSNLPPTRSNFHYPSNRFLYNFTLDYSDFFLFPLKVRIIGSRMYYIKGNAFSLKGSVSSLRSGRLEVQSTPFIADTVGTSSQCPHQRVSVIAGVDFSQTSVICFCRGFSCCPYYRGVRYSGVSARRELTVVGERENGRARRRHARGFSFSRARFFFCAHCFQAPATQANLSQTRGLKKGGDFIRKQSMSLNSSVKQAGLVYRGD